MVTERTFGQLKSRWRVLYRKLECQPDAVKLAALTCIVLHNICIAANDTLPPQLDLTTDPFTQKRRSRDEIRELLFMLLCFALIFMCLHAVIVTVQAITC